jgi:hypothetical protein
MKRETISVLGLILISTITLIRGLLYYIKGGMPDIFQTFLSLACILCWLLASYYYGKAGRKKFLVFTLFFWSIGLISNVVSYYTEHFLFLGIIIYVIVWLPLYGISRYFRTFSLIGEPIITSFIILLPTVLAYIFGTRSSK